MVILDSYPINVFEYNLHRFSTLEKEKAESEQKLKHDVEVLKTQ